MRNNGPASSSLTSLPSPPSPRGAAVKKRVAFVMSVLAIGAIALVGGASARQPVAQASKYCSAYAEEHYGDKNVRTPGGVKCALGLQRGLANRVGAGAA